MMKRGLIAVLLGGTLMASVATADGPDLGINLHDMYPPLDGLGFYHVEGGQVLAPWDVHVQFQYTQTDTPLEIGESGDDPDFQVVQQQMFADLTVALGLPGDLSLALDLPINIDNDGRELNRPDHRIRTGDVGSLRLELKGRLFEYVDRPVYQVAPKGVRWDEVDYPDLVPTWGDAFEGWEVAIAAKLFLSIPTGEAEDFLSDSDDPSGGALISASVRWWRLRFGAELGVDGLSDGIDIGDLEINERLRWGVAVEFLAYLADPEPIPWAIEPEEMVEHQPHTLGFGLELFGWVNGHRPFHNERENPVQIDGYVRYRHTIGLLAAAGGGAAINDGIGAPESRFFFTLGWTF